MSLISQYVAQFAAGKESRHVFDKLFRFALKNVEFKPTGNKIVDDSVMASNDAISSLEKIRLVHKLESVDIETLKGNSLLTWNPVKALECIIADYEKNFYPADTIVFYLDDEHKIKKVADAGMSAEIPEVCLARIIDGSCRELIYGQHDLSEQFKKSSPSHFIEIIKEFGECDVLKGYDMEFVEIIKRFNSLGANAWNQLKLAKSIACKNSSGLNIEDQNELFEIFGGNYDLIKEVECDDCPEAVSLVTNKAAYNKLSANKQKLVRATLGYNQKKFNNAVIADVTAAYSRFKAYQQAQDQELAHTLKQSMSGGYYSNNDQFKKFSADLKKTIASYNFSSITKGADFIVHNYIPLLNRAKSDGIYNNFNHIPFMNSNSLCVLGGGAYVEPKNEVVEVEKIVERQVEVERPVEVERIVEVREVEYIPVEVKEEPIEFIEEPGFKAPVESMTGAGKKAQQLIDDLKKLQVKFNEEFSKEYRKIIAELGKIDAAKIKSGKIDTNLFTALDRILIKSNKTCYKISGVREETKKIALDFVEVCDATATRLSMLSGIAAAIRAIGKLVKQTVSAAEKLRNTYTISDRERYDELDVYYDEIKVSTNFTQEEFSSIYDNFNRILMLIQECNQTKIVSNTEEILKKYINDAKDKNKTIDEFFDFNKAKFEKYAKKHRQMEKLVEMRLIIDNELRKAYKWLNNTFDTTLGKIRLNHLNEHVLIKKVVDRITKNKIMFNPSQSELKIHKLNNKLMTRATEPEYYRSYFKIFKLASKIVDAYGVLDFMELLYKELEIVGSDFKWGEFKQGMTHFMVSNLIGLDLFETATINGDNYPVYRGWSTHCIDHNGAAQNRAPVPLDTIIYLDHISNAAGQYVITHPKMTVDYQVRFGAPAGVQQVPLNTAIGALQVTESFVKTVRYMAEVFGFNEIAEKFTFVAGAPNQIHYGGVNLNVNSYPAGLVGSVMQDNSPIKFGFSIRHVVDRSYINNDIKKISEHIFKSLYTPVLQAFDKFNKQRTTLGNNAFYNVNQLLMGGVADNDEEKMEGASVFDYIEDPTESFYIIKEAGKFYTIGTHILLHYCRHFNTNHHFLKPGKLNRLSKIKKLNKEQIAGSQYDPLNDDEDLKETIMALNSYWKNSNHTLEGAIKVLMKEINTALFFDENGKDIDEFYKIKTDDIIGEINVAMTNNHNILNKECNVTFIDEYLGLADKKLKESTSTENGFGIIKKIVSNKIKEDNTDDMYVAFCDTVLTPISLISQHYQLMLLEFVIDICGLSAELVGQVRQMSRALIDLFGDRSFEKKSLNGGQKMFASNSVLLAYPEIVDQNMTPAQVFGYFTERYNKHVEEFLTVASKFPIISDVKMKTFIEAAKTQFDQVTEQIVESIKREANAIYQEPIENINFSNKFIPVAKNANKKIEKIVKYVNDTSYPFNPVAYSNLTVDQLSNSIQCFDSELNNNYSITRFVCIELTHAMQNGFLPDSFVKKLLETPLYDSVFKALPQQNMKINDKDHKPAFEVENADPLVSLLVHVSRSQIAVQSTLNLVVSKTVINNLCALIPFLIKTLQNYLRVCKKHAYKIGETEIQSKLECEILIDVLKQFYGEISKLGQKKEFGELTTNDKHGYFTDNLIDEQNGNDNDVRSLDYCHQPITYEWIMNYNNVSDEVPSYDRFKSYHENVLKKINDDYFIKNFKERIIPILADIKMKNMMSCINVMFNQENVNGVMMGGSAAMTGGFLPSEIADWAAKYVIYLRQDALHINNDAIMAGNVIKQNTEFDMQAFLFKCGIPINCTGIGAAGDVVATHESIFEQLAGGVPQATLRRYSQYIYGHKTILGGPNANVTINAVAFAPGAGNEYFEQLKRGAANASWMGEHTYYFLHVLPTLIWNYVNAERDYVNKAIKKFVNTIDRNVIYDLMDDVLKICVIHNENNANPAVVHFDTATSLFDTKDSVEALATKCLFVAHYIFNKMRNRKEQRGRPAGAAAGAVTPAHVEQINTFYRAFDVFTIFAAAYRIDLLIDIYSKYDATVKTNEWLRAVESIIKTQQTSHIFINPDYMLRTDIVAGPPAARNGQPNFSIAHCDDNRKDITTLSKNDNKILSQLDLLLNKVYARDKTQSTRKTISNVDKIVKAIGLNADGDNLLALISSVLTLEDTIYQSDSREGAEYKQFLRYGLGYNNWALADACYHSNGNERHEQDKRVANGEQYSGKVRKNPSANSVNYNIFSEAVSPAIVARTIQLGYNLGFHRNGFEWDNEMSCLYGSYINPGSIFDNPKNRHDVFKGDHSKWLHLKLSDDVYLSFESLIEESYSTTKLQPINLSSHLLFGPYNARLKELIDNLECFSVDFVSALIFRNGAGGVAGHGATTYHGLYYMGAVDIDAGASNDFNLRAGGLFYNLNVLTTDLGLGGNNNLYGIAVNANTEFNRVMTRMPIGLNFCHRTYTAAVAGVLGVGGGAAQSQISSDDFTNICEAAAGNQFNNTKVAIAGLTTILDHGRIANAAANRAANPGDAQEARNYVSLIAHGTAVNELTYNNFINGLGAAYPCARHNFKWSNVELFIRHMYQTIVLSDIIKGNTNLNNPMTLGFKEDKPVRTFDITTGTAAPGVTNLSVRVPEIIISIKNKDTWERKSILNYNSLIRMNNNMKTIDNLIKLLKKPNEGAGQNHVAPVRPAGAAAGNLVEPEGKLTWKNIIQDPKIFNKANYDLIQDSIMMIDNYKLCNAGYVLDDSMVNGAAGAVLSKQQALADILNRISTGGAAGAANKTAMFQRVFGQLPHVTTTPVAGGGAVAGSVDYVIDARGSVVGNNVAPNNNQAYGFCSFDEANLFAGNGGDIRFIYGLVYLSAITEHTYFGKNKISESYDYVRVTTDQFEKLSRMYSGFNLEGFNEGLKYNTVDAHEIRIDLGNVIAANKFISISQVLPFLTSIPSNTYNRLWKDHCLIYDNYCGFNVYNHAVAAGPADVANSIAKTCPINLKYDVDQTIPYVYRHIANMISPDYKYDSFKHTLHENLIIEATKKDSYNAAADFNPVSYHKYDNNNTFSCYTIDGKYKCATRNPQTPAIANVGSVTGLLYLNVDGGIANTWYDQRNAGNKHAAASVEGSMNNLVLRSNYTPGAHGAIGHNFGHDQINVLYKIHPLMMNPEFLKAHYNNQFNQAAANCDPYYGAANVTGFDKANSYHTKQFNHILKQSRILSQILEDKTDAMVRINETTTYADLPRLINELTYMYIPTEPTTNSNRLLSAAENYARLVSGLEHNRDVVAHSIYPILKIKDNIKHHDMKLRLNSNEANTNMLKFAPELNYYLSKDIPTFSNYHAQHHADAGVIHSNSASLNETLGDFDAIYANYNKHQYNMIMAQEGVVGESANKAAYSIYDYGLKPEIMRALLEHNINHNNYNDIKISDVKQMDTQAANTLRLSRLIHDPSNYVGGAGAHSVINLFQHDLIHNVFGAFNPAAALPLAALPANRAGCDVFNFTVSAYTYQYRFPSMVRRIHSYSKIKDINAIPNVDGANGIMGLIKSVGEKILNVFDLINTPMRTVRDKRINKAMFGGFSLIENVGIKKINRIYGDANKQIVLQTLFNEQNASTDLAENILSYFKNQMMILTPSFDRHMYMNILYNSKLFSEARRSIDLQIDDPAHGLFDDNNLGVMSNFYYHTDAAHANNNRNLYWAPVMNGERPNRAATADTIDRNLLKNTPVAGGTNHSSYYELYQSIRELDRYNGLMYALIGYMKNLEYYDMEFDTEVPYNVQYDKTIKPVGI